MMDILSVIGLFCGIISLFFAMVAALSYFKIKKLLNMLNDYEIDRTMPFFEKHRRRTYAYTLLCVIFTLATIVLSLIVNI